jgi:hypothetical protein
MKILPILAIGVAAIAIMGAITRFSEPFVPEFLEQSGVSRTAKTKDSSY